MLLPSRFRGMRRRWLIGFGAVFISLAFVAGWHYWTLYVSLTSARSDLLAARATLVRSNMEMSDHDLDVAEHELGSARGNIQRARTHLKWDPLLWAARPLPTIGTQVKAVDEIASMADTLTDLGDESIIIGRQALAAREEQQGTGASLTVAGVQLLEDVEPNLDRIEALINELIERRLKLGDEGLVGPIAEARNRVDEELPDLARTFATAHAWQQITPSLLGFEGDRRYLVLALNNGELMPGGGLVTAAGVLAVSRGQPGDAEFVDSTRWMAMWESQGGEYIEPPGPLKRYLLRGFTWNLLVANWSADFPTWSRQALEFYELVHGPQDVDGVVAVDLTALARLLVLIGPVTLDVPDEGEVQFNSDNVILELERLTRRPDEPGGDRKSVIGDLTEVVLARIQQLPGDDWPALIDVLQELVAGGHIQSFSFQPEEQAAFEAAGADGAIARGADDFLMVNEASVLGTKLSLIAEREAEHSIEILADGTVHHTVTLRLHNPLRQWATGQNPALVEALMGSGLYGAYIRMLVPAQASGFTFEINGTPTGLEDRGVDAGRAWVGSLVPVAPDQTVAITFRWTVQRDPATSPYRLVLQKQPGLDELCTRFTIAWEGVTPQATIDGRHVGAEPICLTRDALLEVAPDGA